METSPEPFAFSILTSPENVAIFPARVSPKSNTVVSVPVTFVLSNNAPSLSIGFFILPTIEAYVVSFEPLSSPFKNNPPI